MQGNLEDVTLLQEITEACRGCVRSFVEERTDNNDQVRACQAAAVSCCLAVSHIPLVVCADVHVCSQGSLSLWLRNGSCCDNKPTWSLGPRLPSSIAQGLISCACSIICKQFDRVINVSQHSSGLCVCPAGVHVGSQHVVKAPGPWGIHILGERPQGESYHLAWPSVCTILPAVAPSCCACPVASCARAMNLLQYYRACC